MEWTIATSNRQPFVSSISYLFDGCLLIWKKIEGGREKGKKLPTYTFIGREYITCLHQTHKPIPVLISTSQSVSNGNVSMWLPIQNHPRELMHAFSCIDVNVLVSECVYMMISHRDVSNKSRHQTCLITLDVAHWISIPSMYRFQQKKY